MQSELQSLLFLVFHGTEGDYGAPPPQPPHPFVRLLEKESSLSLDEVCTMLALREGTVRNYGHSLLLSFLDRSLSNGTTMCSIYQMFMSAQEVLHQQFNR